MKSTLHKKAIQKEREIAWTNMSNKESDSFGKIKQHAFGKYKDKNFYSLSNANVCQPISRLTVLQDKTEQIFGHSALVCNAIFLNLINDQTRFTFSEIFKAIFSFNKN